MKVFLTISLQFFVLLASAQILFYDIANNVDVGEDGPNYGAAVGDFDNDGWDDIYVTRAPGPNRLYRNEGNLFFTEVASDAGVDFAESTRIPLWGDFNNDGCLDLFLANAAGIPDKLYLNNCDGTFEDISTSAGIEDTHLPQAAVLGDVNNDGWLDIYLAHQDGQNILWRNNGNNTFTDITIEAGVTDNLIAMGAVFFDYDNDRDLDLYLTHDGYGPNILFQNDGTGHFTDVAASANADVAALGMGVDVGDINNDGWLDLYITNLYPNNLLLNNGDGTFTDITSTAGDGMDDSGMGWGVSFLDIDNDAFQDLYFTNTAGPANILFHNQGNNTFLNVSDNTPLASTGNNFAAVSLDFNQDGLLDMFVTNSNSSTGGNHLFLNQTTTTNNWVKIKTEGTISNRCGIGARVELSVGDVKCIDEISGGSGWSSQSSMTSHFGVGTATFIDTIKVFWQSGMVDTLTNVPANETYEMVEGLPSYIYTPIDHWETVVYNTDIWSYHVGLTPPMNGWQTLQFDASSWSTSEGGIGYGDDDDATIISATPSLFMRRVFNVLNKSDIVQAVLHADYDDGFIAYLNGVEIARSNMEGTLPAHYAETPELHEAVMYRDGTPEIFWIDSLALQNIFQNGSNVLAIQVHNYEGVVSSDMTANFFLSVGIKDESNVYGATPGWFGSERFETPLPLIRINTNNDYIPDEPSIQATMEIVWNGTGMMNLSDEVGNEFVGNISIERRGQSSQFIFPKDGYAIETKDSLWEDMDASFLGFPAEEDWVLHGPYSDKTLIRNVLSMHLANMFDQYASRTQFVELMINGNYEGIYILMEKIKRDENRVDIATLKEEDISGDELTGGYIFKLDKGEFDWESDFNMINNNLKLRFSYVYPKRTDIQSQQESYIQSYVDSFEYALNNADYTFGGKRYDEYIDLPSFADHFLIQELSKNVDAYRISSYYHKKKDSKGGKIHAGPVWDFNLAWGNADYCNSWTAHSWVYDEHCGIFNPFWWGRMFEDEAFTTLVKCRWDELRVETLTVDSLHQFIDEQATLITPALDRNFKRWNVLNSYVWPNAQVPGSFQGEIDYLKTFVEDRMSWMDSFIFGECVVTDVEYVFQNIQLNATPNPIKNITHINFELQKSGMTTLKIFNLYGQSIATLLSENQTLGNHSIIWKPQHQLQGVYIIELTSGKTRVLKKIILVH